MNFSFSENEVSAQGVAAGSTTLSANSVKTIYRSPPLSNIVYSPQYARLNYQGGNGGWMPATNNIGAEWLQVGTLFNTRKVPFRFMNKFCVSPFLSASFPNESSSQLFKILIYWLSSHTIFQLIGYLALEHLAIFQL